MMPTKTLGNVAITYGALALAQYMDGGSLEATVEAVETTNLASSGQETTPGAPAFSVPISGFWAKALDDVLGADATNPPTTLKNLVVQIGPVGNRVTNTWTGTGTTGAFVSDYKIDFSDPMGMLKWSATLNCSGAPARA
jgi:hypothetical protein